MPFISIGGGGSGGGTGPRGPQGPQGPQGEPGPGANQSLNTDGSVVFAKVHTGDGGFSTSGGFHVGAVGIKFSDGTIQTTAASGGGSSYDQSLNTTDSVSFSSVSTGSITFPDGTVQGTAPSAAFPGDAPGDSQRLMYEYHDGTAYRWGAADAAGYRATFNGAHGVRAFHVGTGGGTYLRPDGIQFPDGTTQSTAGGGASYDQSLNTTDSVSFSSVSAASISNSGSGPISIGTGIGFEQANHGIAFGDGTFQNTATKYRGQWSTDYAYAANDVVEFSGALYKANAAMPAPTVSPNMGQGPNGWAAISGPEGPPGPSGNPFDQDLNTTNSPAFTSLSLGDLTMSAGDVTFGSSIGEYRIAGYGRYVGLETGVIGSAGEYSGWSLVGDFDLSQANVTGLAGFQPLPSPAASAHFIMRSDGAGWSGASSNFTDEGGNTIADANARWIPPMSNVLESGLCVRGFHVIDGLKETIVRPHGIQFADGSFQSTASSGGGGGGGGVDYLPLAGGTMTGPIVFNATGGQNISEGSVDTQRSGYKGISLNCALAYELNWQAGWLNVFDPIDPHGPSRPIYFDSGRGTNVRVWRSDGTAHGTGTEISHSGIVFRHGFTLTSATSDGDVPRLEMSHGISLPSGYGITFGDGSSMTSAAGAVLPDVNNHTGTLLWNAGPTANGWGYSTSGSAAAQWIPQSGGGAGVLQSGLRVWGHAGNAGLSETFIRPHGIQFADGSFQSTAASGGGGANLPNPADNPSLFLWSDGDSAWGSTFKGDTQTGYSRVSFHSEGAATWGQARLTVESLHGSGNPVRRGRLYADRLTFGVDAPQGYIESATFSGSGFSVHSGNMKYDDWNNGGTLTIAGNIQIGSAVTMSSLPTSDPGVAGRIWSDGGTLKVSAG